MLKKIVIKILTLIEKILLKIPIKLTDEVIFITGAPRSGTTITYQYFIELGNFCFFSNEERKNKRYPVLSTLFYGSVKKYKSTTINSFGHIPGRFAPSDGWEIFHRWFPYYYNPDYKLTNKKSLEIYRTIAWFQFIYKKPFIVKNNANSLRIDELKKVFPEAKFIHLERHKEETINSITAGMKKNDIKEVWGTGPDKYLIPSNIQSIEQIANYQFDYIFEFINRRKFVKKIFFNKSDTQDLKNQISNIIQRIDQNVI